MILLLDIQRKMNDDFKNTMKLIEKIKFTNSYSFIFSPRPGTVAADFDLVDKKQSKERLEIIQKNYLKIK